MVVLSDLPSVFVSDLEFELYPFFLGSILLLKIVCSTKKEISRKMRIAKGSFHSSLPK